MREDKSLLVLTHLSQLINLISGVGGFVIPLVLWLTKRDEISGMNEQGKAILNFQISMYIYSLICVPLIFLFGIGVVGLIIIGLLNIIYPIINAIKVDKGELPHYPLSFRIIG